MLHTNYSATISFYDNLLQRDGLSVEKLPSTTSSNVIPKIETK